MKLAKSITSITAFFFLNYSYAWSEGVIEIEPDVLYTEQSVDNESTIRKIITDYRFHSPWAEIAYYLGYAYVGGNTHPNTYEDRQFEYRRIDTQLDDLRTPATGYRYMLNSKYDPNGPAADGYWADKRFRIAFLNIQWKSMPDDVKLEEPQLYSKKPIKTINILLENYGKSDDEGVATLRYESMISWSKADKTSVNGKVTLTNKWSAGLPLIGGTEAAVEVAIEAGADWTTTNGTNTAIGQSAEYRAKLPSRTKRLITLTLYEQKADIPYTSKMFMIYDVELYNFLRYSGNALNGHPTDRPFYLGKFGGRDGLNAGQDLLSQYHNPETSPWDWPWVLDEYSHSGTEYFLNLIAKRKFKQQFSGVFTAVDSSSYTITAGPAVPLPANEGIAAPGGIQYRVLSDISDVPGKVRNLRFKMSQPQAKPSSASPFQ
ncbi:aerolysin family beta-barrel pore-forming toxin [Chromobacterium vaccinii]|uniref:aerolysin family beta-barrel pore-forming toxin n=1 Tax=Chromobacterium vaccinii TaxID=1108595 RepID=UPI003C775C57